jgi:hypothetical protein
MARSATGKYGRLCGHSSRPTRPANHGLTCVLTESAPSRRGMGSRVRTGHTKSRCRGRRTRARAHRFKPRVRSRGRRGLVAPDRPRRMGNRRQQLRAGPWAGRRRHGRPLPREVRDPAESLPVRAFGMPRDRGLDCDECLHRICHLARLLRIRALAERRRASGPLRCRGRLRARVDGRFTTGEILCWTACKWGVDDANAWSAADARGRLDRHPAPGPTTAPRPTVTPGRIMHPVANQLPFSTVTGLLKTCGTWRRDPGPIGWLAVNMRTYGPVAAPSSIRTSQSRLITAFGPITTSSPNQEMLVEVGHRSEQV